VAADIQSITSAAQRRDVQRVSQAEAAGQEFLVFTLGAEEYGIDILKVQEIRGYDNVTRIANAPAFIKGVINLRGIIVPIVDMRIKFNLGRVEYDNQTVVIILNVAHRVVGMVVDGVSSIGGYSVPVDAWGVDMCVTASQKCIAAPPGMVIISLPTHIIRPRERWQSSTSNHSV